jgi:hypothetical protein
MYGVCFHIRLRRRRCLVDGTLAVVVEIGTGTERTSRGSQRVGHNWGRLLTEFNVLEDSVREV